MSNLFNPFMEISQAIQIFDHFSLVEVKRLEKKVQCRIGAILKVLNPLDSSICFDERLKLGEVIPFFYNLSNHKSIKLQPIATLYVDTSSENRVLFNNEISYKKFIYQM
jgi:hypothetical protein